MKNKNNLVLSIIAIVTILVTVVGATFAYFASTVNEGTGSALTTIVDENDVLFTATGSNMTMEITADKMTQHASKDGVIVAGDSSDSIMNVTLTTGTEGSIACNYNIYFQWENSNNAYLTKTTGAIKEFTAQLALTDPNGTGSAGTNKFASETQLTDVVTTVNKTLVVEGASIVANASQSGSQSWTPTIKFYNLQLNQTDLAGKTFKGKFTIDDVECAGVKNLSEEVIAHVSNADYISSQDGTKYNVAKEEIISPNSNAQYDILTENDYGQVTAYKGNNFTSTSGTSLDDVFIFDPNDNTYSNDTSKMAARSFYHIVLPITSSGYYQMCYKVNTSASGNNLRAYLTDSQNSKAGTMILGTLTTSTKPYQCDDIGYLDSTKAIRVVHRTMTSFASVSFYLQKTTNIITTDAGIRYEGENPDNYITFNNGEEWRIIGVFEGSTIGLEPGKQYTKIIQSQPKMSMEWDIDPAGDGEGGSIGYNSWPDSSINEYLNNEYLNSLSGSEKIARYNNNYSLWYVRETSTENAENAYLSERFSGSLGWANKQMQSSIDSFNGAIGLVYPSDIGYAAYGSECKKTDLDSFFDGGYGPDPETGEEDVWVTSGCGTVDWLYDNGLSQEVEWSISPCMDYEYSVYGFSSGYMGDMGDNGLGYYTVYDKYAFRPTLYLEANVTATGAGTKLDPYVLQ